MDRAGEAVAREASTAGVMDIEVSAGAASDVDLLAPLWMAMV